ncbi:MAG: hypothetical protein QXS54_10410 [Candidatus Methanomethylicaceae archaeon]
MVHLYYEDTKGGDTVIAEVTLPDEVVTPCEECGTELEGTAYAQLQLRHDGTYRVMRIICWDCLPHDPDTPEDYAIRRVVANYLL